MTAPVLKQEKSDKPEDLIHRKMIEALRRQVDLLQNTLDSMTAAVFILNDKAPNPTILECNRAASTIFGYHKQEIIGRTMRVSPHQR